MCFPEMENKLRVATLWNEYSFMKRQPLFVVSFLINVCIEMIVLPIQIYVFICFFICKIKLSHDEGFGCGHILL